MHDPPTALNSAPADAAGMPLLALPRVSIIVTCFNYGRFIADALQSVTAQTYRNWDCVVVDDGSTDDSAFVIGQWLAKAGDARFRLVRSDTNQGQLASIAKGLAASESEFVALLDADDFWFPEFLQRHVAAHLNRAVAVSLTCSDLLHMAAARHVLTGGFNSTKLWRNKKTKLVVPISKRAIPHIGSAAPNWGVPSRTRAVFVTPDILIWHWTATSAMVFRRPMLKLAIPSAPQALRFNADVYLASICHYFTGSIVLDQALGAYRRHESNNYSDLPVFAAMTFHSTLNADAQQFAVYQMILRHALDQQELFASVFGRSTVSKFIRTIFRYLLGCGQPVDDPRVRGVIGNSRYYRDRFRVVLRRLRRKGRYVPSG